MRRLVSVFACLFALLVPSFAFADGYIVRDEGWYGNIFSLGKGANVNTLTMSGSTITLSGGLTVTGALSVGSAGWPSAITLPALGSTITGTVGEPLSLVRTMTDATAEKGFSLSGTALDTTSGTTAQYLQWINNAASSEAFDALTLYDTADADDTVGAVIKVLNTGAGTGYTYLIDTPNLDISYAGAITGCTGITASGGGSLTGTWTDLGTVTTVDLNGGTIDGTAIGGSTPAAIAGTTGTFTNTLTTQAASLTTSGVGAITVVTGLTVAEQGNSVVHKTVFTFTGVTFNVTDAGVGDEGWGTQQLYTFPAGAIQVLGTVSDIHITGGGAIGGGAGSGDFAIGTAASTDESALATTLANFAASTALTEPFVGGVGDANKAAGHQDYAAAFDGTTTTGTGAVEAHLNMIFDAGNVPGNTTVTLDGTVTITWINMGDF